MLLKLDDRDSSPLYLQIAAAVRRAMAEGKLSAGERLPTARFLAQSLGVNMHTVLRGYAELESEGLVQMRRSRGVTVCAQPQGRARLFELARQLKAEARHLGIDQEELTMLLSEME